MEGPAAVFCKLSTGEQHEEESRTSLKEREKVDKMTCWKSEQENVTVYSGHHLQSGAAKTKKCTIAMGLGVLNPSLSKFFAL